LLQPIQLVSLDLQRADVAKLRRAHGRVQVRHDLFVPEPRTLVGPRIVQVLLTELRERNFSRLGIFAPLDLG
jgi:hypothetical protein